MKKHDRIFLLSTYNNYKMESDNITEKQITLVFDDDILEKYLEHYFKLYPKRKKKPIDSPLHPSINKWFIMKRPQMNDFKQRWKDFTVWVVQYYGYENLQIDKCSITYKFYYPTKHRQDNDNRSPKFLNDGLVESGLLIEDDYQHLNPTIIWGGYDKDYPRMEVIIDY